MLLKYTLQSGYIKCGLETTPHDYTWKRKCLSLQPEVSRGSSVRARFRSQYVKFRYNVIFE